MTHRMANVCMCFILMFLAPACDKTDPTQRAMHTVVREYHKRLNRDDYDGILAMFAKSTQLPNLRERDARYFREIRNQFGNAEPLGELRYMWSEEINGVKYYKAQYFTSYVKRGVIEDFAILIDATGAEPPTLVSYSYSTNPRDLIMYSTSPQD